MKFTETLFIGQELEYFRAGVANFANWTGMGFGSGFHVPFRPEITTLDQGVFGLFRDQGQDAQVRETIYIGFGDKPSIKFVRSGGRIAMAQNPVGEDIMGVGPNQRGLLRKVGGAAGGNNPALSVDENSLEVIADANGPAEVLKVRGLDGGKDGARKSLLVILEASGQCIGIAPGIPANVRPVHGEISPVPEGVKIRTIADVD